MDGRWTLCRDTEGLIWATDRTDDGADLPEGMSLVPVVPCDEAAIERATRGLARAFGEEVGFADWQRIASTVLRAAGETP